MTSYSGRPHNAICVGHRQKKSGKCCVQFLLADNSLLYEGKLIEIQKEILVDIFTPRRKAHVGRINGAFHSNELLTMHAR